jgi:hypothetical protein
MRALVVHTLSFAALCVLLLFAPGARADGPTPEDAASADDAAPVLENGAALAEPPAGVPPRRAQPVAPPADEAPPWDGPRVELGYVHYVLGDGFGGGSVHAVSFGGYLPTGQLRLGLIGEGGGRDYALGGGDAVLRATLVAGWQGTGLIDYVVPYLAAVASCGVVVGQRFATTFASALLGLGIEIGFEVNPVRTLHFGASLAHVRADLDGLGYGLWVVRLFAGL